MKQNMATGGIASIPPRDCIRREIQYGDIPGLVSARSTGLASAIRQADELTRQLEFVEADKFIDALVKSEVATFCRRVGDELTKIANDYLAETADAIGECERCGVVDHHLQAGLCSACHASTETLDPPPIAALHDGEPATCVICGCDDRHACWDDETYRPCHWLVVDRERGAGLCSACRDYAWLAEPLIASVVTLAGRAI